MAFNWQAVAARCFCRTLCHNNAVPSKNECVHLSARQCLMSSAVTRFHPDTSSPQSSPGHRHIFPAIAPEDLDCPISADLNNMEATMRLGSSTQASCSYTVQNRSMQICNRWCRPTMLSIACRQSNVQRTAVHIFSVSDRTLCPGLCSSLSSKCCCSHMIEPGTC